MAKSPRDLLAGNERRFVTKVKIVCARGSSTSAITCEILGTVQFVGLDE
jgi:hypothetical protein